MQRITISSNPYRQQLPPFGRAGVGSISSRITISSGNVTIHPVTPSHS